MVCVDDDTSTYFDERDYILKDGSGTVVLSRYATHVTVRLLETRAGRETGADALIGLPGKDPDTI